MKRVLDCPSLGIRLNWSSVVFGYFWVGKIRLFWFFQGLPVCRQKPNVPNVGGLSHYLQRPFSLATLYYLKIGKMQNRCICGVDIFK